MALNRAQLVMGNSSQGVVLPGQVQGVTQGTGVSIAANGAISFDSTSATGVLKTNNPTAYNTYVWPTTIGAAGQQLQLGAGGALSWEDPGGIPWTAKGQLVVGTGLATSTILNVGSNGSILIADSSTTSGLNYTADYVATTGPTSAAILPAGNTGGRPLTPPAGAFRYNSTSTNLEFFNGSSWEIVASSISNDFVEKTSDTGIALIPAGTSAQRPVASTYAGGFRFNSDLDTIEFSDGLAWKQLVMLNNLTGYNAYVWPNADGAYGSFLQTDAAGNLSWENPAFVGTTAPTPASDGMLWYDCNVGYLKVYQSCVAPNGWTKVAEPGLPILTANMSASPAFSSGSGTSGSPYVVTTSTVAPGDSVLIPNTITVTGLAPNQFVPITDLAAVANGGRFSFTNNYADSSGTLVFQTVFNDSPASAPSTSYTANIRVGYASAYIDAFVSVVLPLSVTAGSISGTPQVGQTLTYTPGVASGGSGTGYTYAYQWKANGSPIGGATGLTYVPVGGDLGKTITVTITATDSTSSTATATTTPTAAVSTASVTNAVAPTIVPGTASFVWSDGAGSLTATGCIQFNVNGGPFGAGPTAVVNTDAIQTQWVNLPSSGVCGDAADGTTITGSLTDGSRVSNFSLLIDRVPSAFVLAPNAQTTTPSTVTSVNPSFTVSGTNSPCYLWGTFATTGGSPQYSIDGGTTWATLPSAPGSVFLDPGANVQVRFTTGSSPTTEVLTVNAGASLTAKQSANFTVTVSSSTFPLSTFGPAGAPNASPASINISGQSLYGTASCASWADGTTTLSSTGGLQFRVNASAYGTGPIAVANTNTVDLIWDPAAITAAADGATLTGTLTDGAFTNTYTITIDRSPLNLSFTDLTSQAVSSTVQSATVTATGFNVPVSIALAGTATDPLTTLRVSVGGGGFATSPQTVDPGQALQIQGGTGAANSTTYGMNVTMGSGPSATDTWTAATISIPPSITTPSISTPANNSTNIGTSAGVTITSDTYAANNGAGTPQTSSVWEVYQWIGGASPTAPTTEPPAPASYTAITGSPFTVSASPFTSLDIAKPPLLANTTYYVRVKYATTNTTATTSSFSAWSGFTTGALPTTANTWASATTPAGLFNQFAFYVSGTYLMSGSGITSPVKPIISSSDGITWTAPAATGWNATVSGMGVDGGAIYVCVSSTTSNVSTFTVGKSTDSGASYSVVNPTVAFAYVTSGNSRRQFTAGAGKLCVVALAGMKITPTNYTNFEIYTSSDDGSTWTKTYTFPLPSSSTTTFPGAWSINYVNGKFICFAVTNSNGGTVQVATSTDGTTWTAGTSVSASAAAWEYFNYRADVIWDGTQYVTISSYGGPIFTSPTGSAWTKTTVAAFASETTDQIGYRTGLYLVTTRDGNVYTSPDLVTWTGPITTPLANTTNDNTNAVVSYAPKFVLGRNDGPVVYSAS